MSVASLGLIIELYSPGFGVAGTMGLISLVLFFFGHLVAGLAGYETIIIFVIGVLLIVAEFFLPFGISGILGAGAIILSIILAGGNVTQMSIAVLIALTVTIVGMVIIMKFFGKKLRMFNKMILSDATSTDKGYVSNENRTDLIGKVAITMTPLRPSGTIRMDNERIDAVSDGSYIDKDKHVKIIKVEGSRIVVTRNYRRGGNKMITGSTITLIVIIVLAFIVLAVFFTFVPIALWISALAAGVKISIFTLIGMRLRRVIPSRIVNPLIKAHKAGLVLLQLIN